MLKAGCLPQQGQVPGCQLVNAQTLGRKQTQGKPRPPDRQPSITAVCSRHMMSRRSTGHCSAQPRAPAGPRRMACMLNEPPLGNGATRPWFMASSLSSNSVRNSSTINVALPETCFCITFYILKYFSSTIYKRFIQNDNILCIW